MWCKLLRGGHNHLGPKRKCSKGPEKKDTCARRNEDKVTADSSLDTMREEQHHLSTEGKGSRPSILYPEKMLLRHRIQKDFSSADGHCGSIKASVSGWKQMIPEQIGVNTEERTGSGMETTWKRGRYSLINVHLFKMVARTKVVTTYFGVSDICVSGRRETRA